MSASSRAVRRLRQDFQAFRQSPPASIAALPSGADALRWDFLFHSLPGDTPYAGGVYHGYLVFPPDYPLAPPKAFMCTPSGRLETGRSICLSATAFHPEQWNPAWTAQTLLVGILSFFLSEEAAVGTVWSPDDTQRRRLAALSRDACRESAELREMFPELLGDAHAPPPPMPEAAASTPFAALAVPLLEAEGPAATPRDAATTPAARGRCWICLDEESGEALIQPCACRGSMSGVHASCINEWVAQQASDRGQVEPSCPVCRQAYRGCRTEYPGLSVFVAEWYEKVKGSWPMRRLPRFLCMILFMRLYLELWPTEAPSHDGGANATHVEPAVLSPESDDCLDVVWAVLVAVGLTLSFLERALILALSLPRGDLLALFLGGEAPEPRHPALRLFYVGSGGERCCVGCEMQLSLVLWWWWPFRIPSVGMLPFAVYILPVITVLAYRSFRHCAFQLMLLVVLLCLLLVFLPYFTLLLYLFSIGGFLLVGVGCIHPGDAGFHIITAVLIQCIAVLPDCGQLIQMGTPLAGAVSVTLAYGSSGVSVQAADDVSVSMDCSALAGEMDAEFPRTLRWIVAAVMVSHTGCLVALLVDGFCIGRIAWRPGRRQWLVAGVAVLQTWINVNAELYTSVVMGCAVRLQTAAMAAIASTWAGSFLALIVLVAFKRWQDARSWHVVVTQ